MPTDPKSMALVLAHRGKLISYALRIVRNRTIAEDVVQEAYLKFWAHTGASGSATAAVAEPLDYLYRIVRNIAFDLLRRPAHRLTGHLDSETLDTLATPEASPEVDAIWRQELSLVQEVIDGLPERTRIAFEMHRLGGRTLQEVADHLGVSVTRAHQLIRQALVKCALRLEALEESGGDTRKKSGEPEKKRGLRV